MIEQARGSGHRIFTVGVGSSVAEPFVRALAEATGGACELVTPRADMGERIHRHFQRIGATPVREARLRWPAPARHMTPDPLPTPWPGDTMHLFGSFPERPRGAVVLEMELVDGRTVSQRMEIDADPDETAAAPSDLARPGAARRLAAVDDPAQAAALAVRYQLLCEWTSYLVVHVREAADKAAALPDLVKVPQVLAAGWHGVGTVHADGLAAEARMVGARFRADSVAEPCASSAPWAPDDRQAATPAELVAELNEWPIPPLPAFDDLVARLPDEVRDGLAALVDGGTDTESVVIVFLYLLSASAAGRALDRQRRRQILAAWKRLSVDDGTVSAVRRIQESWAPQT